MLALPTFFLAMSASAIGLSHASSSAVEGPSSGSTTCINVCPPPAYGASASDSMDDPNSAFFTCTYDYGFCQFDRLTRKLTHANSEDQGCAQNAAAVSCTSAFASDDPPASTGPENSADIPIDSSPAEDSQVTPCLCPLLSDGSSTNSRIPGPGSFTCLYKREFDVYCQFDYRTRGLIYASDPSCPSMGTCETAPTSDTPSASTDAPATGSSTKAPATEPPSSSTGTSVVTSPADVSSASGSTTCKNVCPSLSDGSPEILRVDETSSGLFSCRYYNRGRGKTCDYDQQFRRLRSAPDPDCPQQAPAPICTAMTTTSNNPATASDDPPASIDTPTTLPPPSPVVASPSAETPQVSGAITVCTNVCRPKSNGSQLYAVSDSSDRFVCTYTSGTVCTYTRSTGSLLNIESNCLQQATQVACRAIVPVRRSRRETPLSRALKSRQWSMKKARLQQVSESY